MCDFTNRLIALWHYSQKSFKAANISVLLTNGFQCVILES